MRKLGKKLIAAAQTDFATANRPQRLAEAEANLAGPYVGGMTEYWQRQKDFLMKEIADNPSHPTNMHMEREISTLNREQASYVQKMYPDDGDFYVTNPAHGGKVTCYKCGQFITEKEHVGYHDHQHSSDFSRYHFHKLCFNQYEHYYGIDKPID